MTVKEKYLILIDHYCGGNKRRFATSIGVSATVIDNIVGTRESKPSFEVLKKTISTYEDLNPRWLISDIGVMTEIRSGDPPCLDKNALEMIRDLSAENAILKRDLVECQNKTITLPSQHYGNRVAEP